VIEPPERKRFLRETARVPAYRKIRAVCAERHSNALRKATARCRRTPSPRTPAGRSSRGCGNKSGRP